MSGSLFRFLLSAGQALRAMPGAAGDDYQDASLMTTYNYDCGKIFFSVYETSQSIATITPQEYVLIYITLEVGVCEGEHDPPE